MNDLLTSFKKRLALVLIFFSISPLILFGFYAYNDLLANRKDMIENSYYETFLNDFEQLDIWFENKRLNLKSDGKLHFLSNNRNKNEGVQEGRAYKIIREGSESFKQLEKKYGSDREYIAEFINFNTSERLVDERTVLLFYAKDQDLASGEKYFIREEVHLKELVLNLEKAMRDHFISYSIFIEDKILYSQNRMTYLDPYTPYYNRDRFVTINNSGNAYMGVRQGSDAFKIYVSAFREYSSAINMINAYQASFAVKIGMLGIFGVVVSLLIAQKFNYPINKLKQASEDILGGNLDSRIEVIDMDEFGLIFQTFNHFAELESENYRRILDSGKAIGNKNRQLIELNREMQQSYEQLKLAIANLELSKQKQETLLNNIGDMIWTMTPEGIVTYINQAVTDILGCEPSDIIDRPITEFISSFDGDLELERFGDRIRSMDIENLGTYFLRADRDEKVCLFMNTKRIHENLSLRMIQGFARMVSDDWLIQHMMLKRNKEMEITSQISWVLANSILLEELLDQIIQKIEELLNADLCLVGLMEEDQVNIVNVGGLFSGYSGEIRLAMASDIFIEVLDTQGDIHGSEFYQVFRAANESLYDSIQDFTVLPLRFDKKTIGFLGIASSRQFNESDLRVMRIISHQSAVAIDKAMLYKALKEDYLTTIRVLATAVEAKDSYTEGHSYRVSRFARLIAEQISSDEDFIEEIEISGILHDIGKIGIFDQILTKRGRLSQEEYGEIQRHPVIGHKIIEPIRLSKRIIDGILLHHKRYDLSGYPEDIEINELPFSAGIIGVADAMDAITSTRSYSKAKELSYAVAEMKQHAGTQFHPEAVNAIVKIFEMNPDRLMQVINEEL